MNYLIKERSKPRMGCSGSLILVLVLLLTLLQATLHLASACDPVPDYWFVEVFSVEHQDLPEGISIRVAPESTVRGYLSIENSSQESLFVLPQGARQSIVATEEPPVSEGGLLEEEYSVEEILLVERVPEFVEFTVAGGEILTLSVEELPRIDYRLVDHNVLDYDRPSFVAMPPAQRSEMYLVFEDQLFEVVFTIGYKLNQQFAPEDCSQEETPKEPTQTSSPEAERAATITPATTAEEVPPPTGSEVIPIGILVFVLILVVWVVWRGRQRA